MPTVEQMLGLGHLPKLGQGFRGGNPHIGAAPQLAPPPGIPHIRPVQRPPQINYGAVAQVGRQPRPQNPLTAGLPSFIQHLPHVPLAQAQPSKYEQQALNHIWSDDVVGLKKMPKQVKQLMLNPTPLMQAHINSMRDGHQNHQDMVYAVQNNDYNTNSPGWGQRINKMVNTPQQRQELRQIAQQAKLPQPSTMGFGALGLGAVGNYLQTSVGTPLAKLGEGFGPGLADLAVHGFKEGAHLGYATDRAMGMHPGGGDPGSQGAYFGQLGKGMLHSYEQTALHPLWDLQNPVEAGLNILPFVTAGVGTAAKVGDIAEIAGSADLSATEKAAQIAQRLRAPHGIERSISTGIPDQHFDRAGFDNMGFHKEDYVPPDHLGGQHFPRMPIYANVKHPEESIFGPPGLSHADITPAHGPHGNLQASAILEDGKIAKINLHGKGGGLSPEQEKVLVQALRYHAGNKLDEAGRMSLHSITPPAAKSALGAIIQKGLDHATEHAMSGDTGFQPSIRAFGRYYKIPQPVTSALRGRWGKLARLDLEMRTQMERGVAEQHILAGMQEARNAPRPLTQEMAAKDLPAAEAQKAAYAQGAAKVHAEEWHNLYNGGMGANDHILNNLNDYVAIKKPPDRADILKNAKAYNSNRNIANQWNNMVVRGENAHDVISAAPHDYSFIPKKAFDKMRPVPSEMMQHVGQFLQPMDNVTQIIRSGRFMTPAYLNWAVQNGVLHLSQAGMYAFRNFARVRSELPKMAPEDRAAFENAVGSGHYGGGITRASAGSEETKLGAARLEKLQPVRRYKNFAAKAARFWHAVDDAPFRNASFVHELARYGYHDAADYTKLLHENPQKFRMIARQAQREAIDYSEMSPAERATFQKLFTAWGWTRGATSFAGRFPFQHPFQATVGAQLARHGEKVVSAPYEKAGGMVPEWLSSYLPVGHGGLVDTNVLNPFSTPSSLMQAMGGVTKGQTSNLAQLEAPAPAALEEWARGETKYGQALRGNQRFTQPLQDLASRFKPLDIYHTLIGSKKGGGTFAQSRTQALEQMMGVPYQKLTDIKKTAALGMKDYEQALSMPDEINFRYNHSLQMMPDQIKQLRKAGLNITNAQIGKWKGDLEAVKARDLYMLQYANAHGAKSFKSLPPINKVQAAIAFNIAHHYITKADGANYLQQLQGVKDDSVLNSYATTLWNAGGIGTVSKTLTDALKNIQPATKTPARP